MKHRYTHIPANAVIGQNVNAAYSLVAACVSIMETEMDSGLKEWQVWTLLQMALQLLATMLEECGIYPTDPIK